MQAKAVVITQAKLGQLLCTIHVAGYNSIILYFTAAAENPGEATVQQSMVRKLKSDPTLFITEVIPSYLSVLIEFDHRHTDHEQLAGKLLPLLETDMLYNQQAEQKPAIEVPVWYSIQSGPDLPALCEATGLSEQQVIDLHSQVEYQVKAIGFAPGFAYLGTLPEALQFPRLRQPKDAIPAGSIAIAEQHSAIYPIDCRGSWHVIGRTPLSVFDKNALSPCLLSQGDKIRFVPISESEFQQWRPHQDDD